MRKLAAWLVRPLIGLAIFGINVSVTGIKDYYLFHLKQKDVITNYVLVKNEIKRSRRYDT